MITKYTLSIFLLLVSLLSFETSAQEDTTPEKKEQTIKPELKIGGRIHYDFEFLKQENYNASGDDYSLNGQEFRAIYISAVGSLTKNIKFKAEFDFAGSKVGYRDLYIKFVDIPVLGGNLIFGNQPEPGSMDILTGGNFVLFNERSLLTATQNFRWNSGIGYENFDLLKGKLGLQMTYAFNGKNTEGFTDAALENGAHFVGRLSSPIYENKEQKKLVHLGVNYENRKYTEAPANYTLKFRPENHMGYQISVPFSLLKNQQDVGFEFATIMKSFTFQSEYELAGYQTLLKDYKLDTYYVALSYFLTGDSRSYSNGVFGRISPYKNFSFEDKTFGAFEILARYSGMDYSDIITSGFNDKVNSLTFGLNWYFNSHSRLMYNYISTDLNNPGDNNKLNQHQFRIQVDF